MHIKPKKRLGQNFLIDKNIEKKIINALELKDSDIILEIGAGRGQITECIAKRVREVIALEIDSSLVKLLRDKFKTYTNIKIINQDILKFDLAKYFRDFQEKFKVFGNIPYYISSPLIEYLFKRREKILDIFITVQKEFAERLIAKPCTKQYGALSCFVQYYASPKIIFRIKRNSFFPVPKVDSAFLQLKTMAVPSVRVKDEQALFKIIRTAFSQRRKTLRNSLKEIISAQRLAEFCIKYDIDLNTRPECLTLQDFANLTDTFL